MAASGQVIRNPATGETTEFLATSADTGGRLLRIEMTADPKAAGADEHIHPKLTERYDMQEGRLTVRMHGRDHVIEAGEHFEIPRGTPHSFWNPDDRPARVIVEFEPAGRFESFMETVYALARDGKTNAKGRPRLLQAAVIAQAHLDDIALARPPVAVQRVLFAVLAPLGRLLGYRAAYPAR
jgi:mannose-6-phosphate isomerase-like protein (cupin superfamily)